MIFPLTYHTKNTFNPIFYWNKKRLLALVFIAVGLTGFSQTFTIKADKDSILIGEPIQLSLELNKTNQNNPLIWPNFVAGDSLPEGFEVLETLPKQTNNNNKNVETQQLIITSFYPGNRVISPFVMQDTGHVILSNTLFIKVKAIPADTTAPIKDIKPIKQAQLTFKDKLTEWLAWAKNNWYIPAIILLVLLFLIWILFIKKKKQAVKTVPIITKPLILPHKQALIALKQIEEEKLWQHNKQKEYYDKITTTIKEYIANRYQLSTQEKTSNEIIQSIQASPINNELKASLHQLLTLSDLVKFAKQNPTEQENKNIMKNAVDFINQTKENNQ